MIVDPLIGGIAIGCIYSLIALGYNMIIRAMDLLHFAQGEVMMVGALTGVTLVATFKVPYLLAIPLVMVVCALLGLTLDALAYRPIRHRQVSTINVIIATLGASILLANVAMLVWGRSPSATRRLWLRRPRRGRRPHSPAIPGAPCHRRSPHGRAPGLFHPQRHRRRHAGGRPGP